MRIDKKAVLHEVDLESNFNAATFLKRQTVEGVWASFISCWATLYIGFPENEGRPRQCFSSVRWTNRTDAVGTELQTSVVEAHNALGNGERCHAPPRRVYNKVKHESPKLEPKVALQLAVKAMNDTMGPNGLVPSFLVFGCIPRFPSINSRLPEQQNRMKALEKARTQIATIFAEQRISKAMASQVPRNSDLIIESGDKVRFYRETDKKYAGPFPVIRIDGKQVYLLQDDREVQFGIHQVILATTYDSIVNGEKFAGTLRSVLPSF